MLGRLQGHTEALARAARYRGRDAARDLRALTMYGYLPAYAKKRCCLGALQDKRPPWRFCPACGGAPRSRQEGRQSRVKASQR
eukprot:15455934-Alexandrium_andersonii.AAC.1